MAAGQDVVLVESMKMEYPVVTADRRDRGRRSASHGGRGRSTRATCSISSANQHEGSSQADPIAVDVGTPRGTTATSLR